MWAGQAQTAPPVQVCFGQEADIGRVAAGVCFGPEADIRQTFALTDVRLTESASLREH